MDRVVVVGGPGAGKTRVAIRVARALGAEHVELDGLWWQPGWVHVEPLELVALVQDRLRGKERWVVDGNYLDEVGADLVWPSADTVVWLDLPRRTCVRRAVLRTALRTARRQRLWKGNRETVSNLGPRVIASLWRRWPGYGDGIRSILSAPGSTHLRVTRLRSVREVRAWLRAMPVASSTAPRPERGC